MIKYPRTFHVPWSLGIQSDDKVIKNMSYFVNKKVTVTIKKDGENSTLYRNYSHARSLDSADHESRHWLKSFHSTFAYQIPEDWRLCGENLFAKHSIHYKHLSSFFMLFSIWNENNMCLSWDETVDWANLLEIEVVPVIYRGIYNEQLIQKSYHEYCKKMKELYDEEVEGYVIRIDDSFHYDNFNECVAKYVREGHVQTNEHWRHSKIIPNELENK